MRLLFCFARLALIASALTAPLVAQTVVHTPRGANASPAAHAWSRFATQSKLALSSLEAPAEATPFAAAPPGVTDLAFAEFFGPIGDRGLEYSDKLRALTGRRVRLAGFMVREQERAPGLFRFAGWPVVVENSTLCSVDDTPPNVAYVIVPTSGPNALLPPWRPGRLELIGTLEFGPRTEPDGRNSFVRLVLDDSNSLALFRPSAPSQPTASTTP